MKAIEINNLSFGYTKDNLIEHLSFTVDSGNFLTIAGPNGTGKSTLIKLIAAQLRPGQGSISIFGNTLNSYSAKKLARKIAIVKQEFVPTFGFTVYETVMMARTPYFDFMGFEKQADRTIVEWALHATQTSHLSDRGLEQLSGGERQRVFIARALAQDTPILLLDEPTSSLDLHHQITMYDMLKRLAVEKNITIVSICHNLNLSAQYSDQILLLGHNREHYIASPKEIFSKNKISHFFSVEGFTTNINNIDLFIPTSGHFKGTDEIT